jgi:hypothetical protein
VPEAGDEFTYDEAMAIVNWPFADGVNWRVCNNWHQGEATGGAFEPRAMNWGYQDGFPLYAGIEVDGVKYHVYWRDDKGGVWFDDGMP